MKIIKQLTPFKPDIGDLLSGENFIHSLLPSWSKHTQNSKKEDDSGIFLSNFHNNPWQTLSLLNIDATDFINEVKYSCIWSNNIFYRFVPFALISTDYSQYRTNELRHCKLSKPEFDFHFDAEWHGRYLNGITYSGIIASFGGQGYDSCCLPSDGSGDWLKAFVELDNHDKILGFVHVWYNK